MKLATTTMALLITSTLISLVIELPSYNEVASEEEDGSSNFNPVDTTIADPDFDSPSIEETVSSNGNDEFISIYDLYSIQQIVELLILERALFHFVDPQRLLRVAKCESKLWPWAVNPSSGSAHIFQWLPGIGNAWHQTPAYKDLGISIWHEYQISNPDAIYFDIDQAAWAFANGLSSQWSCK